MPTSSSGAISSSNARSNGCTRNWKKSNPRPRRRRFEPLRLPRRGGVDFSRTSRKLRTAEFRRELTLRQYPSNFDQHSIFRQRWIFRKSGRLPVHRPDSKLLVQNASEALRRLKRTLLLVVRGWAE